MTNKPAIGIGITASVPAEHCGGPLPIRLLPEGRKRFGLVGPMSLRYQGDPNPSRIRIPEHSEERVFDADFLSKSSFFVLASSWKCLSQLTSPAVVFWVYQGSWNSELCSLLESVRIKLGSGSLPRFLGDKGGYSPADTVYCPKAGNGFGGLTLCRAGTQGILIRRAYGSRKF